MKIQRLVEVICSGNAYLLLTGVVCLTSTYGQLKSDWCDWRSQLPLVRDGGCHVETFVYNAWILVWSFHDCQFEGEFWLTSSRLVSLGSGWLLTCVTWVLVVV